MSKRTCPNCGSDDITVSAPPSVRGTDFWDNASCNQCGYPDFPGTEIVSGESLQEDTESKA